jgi:hypothetical protein
VSYPARWDQGLALDFSRSWTDSYSRIGAALDQRLVSCISGGRPGTMRLSGLDRVFDNLLVSEECQNPGVDQVGRSVLGTVIGVRDDLGFQTGHQPGRAPDDLLRKEPAIGSGRPRRPHRSGPRVRVTARGQVARA